MGLQRCLFHLKNRHFQGLHAHTHPDKKKWIPPHYGIDAGIFVCLLGFFSLQQLLSAIKFLQLEVYDVVKSCLSHVRDVGGSTGTIKWPHWFVALLCFALFFPDQSAMGGTCIYFCCTPMQKVFFYFFFKSLCTFCKHVHHIPSLNKQFIVPVQRNESFADKSACSSMPTLTAESQCAIESVCHAVCIKDSRCSAMQRTQQKKEKRSRAESNLDSFTRSNNSFSNHLVIACYYRRQRLFRHLLRVCISEGKRQRVFLCWPCAASLCVWAEKGKGGDKRKLWKSPPDQTAFVSCCCQLEWMQPTRGHWETLKTLKFRMKKQSGYFYFHTTSQWIPRVAGWQSSTR